MADQDSFLMGECLKAAAAIIAARNASGQSDSRTAELTVNLAKQMYLEATRATWERGSPTS